MTKFLTRAGLLAGLFAGAVLFTTGCGKTDGTGAGPVAENKDKPNDKEKDKDKGPGKAEEKDDHSGWWCKEHGIPEEECSMCSDAYAKKCKDKGDWCEKHDRAESQCFICHPEYKEKFAAKYRAKYGKEPPPTKPEKVTKPEVDDKKGEKPRGPVGAAAPTAPAPGTATTITVPDMDCETCAGKLVKKLTAVAGVAKVEADVKAQTLKVTPTEKESPSPKVLWETCADAGYDPSKLEGPGGVFTTKPSK